MVKKKTDNMKILKFFLIVVLVLGAGVFAFIYFSEPPTARVTQPPIVDENAQPTQPTQPTQPNACQDYLTSDQRQQLEQTCVTYGGSFYCEANFVGCTNMRNYSCDGLFTKPITIAARSVCERHNGIFSCSSSTLSCTFV